MKWQINCFCLRHKCAKLGSVQKYLFVFVLIIFKGNSFCLNLRPQLGFLAHSQIERGLGLNIEKLDYVKSLTLLIQAASAQFKQHVQCFDPDFKNALMLIQDYNFSSRKLIPRTLSVSLLKRFDVGRNVNFVLERSWKMLMPTTCNCKYIS